MSQYVNVEYDLGNGSTYKGLHTDHAVEINLMRGKVAAIMAEHPDAGPKTAYYEATICMAAAALLECHDATGISLDEWIGPRELVESALTIVGRDDAFLVNEV